LSASLAFHVAGNHRQ
jgi:hypothetical protein